METILEIKDYVAKDVEDDNEINGFEIITDKQTIKMFIDNYGQCCEKWGHFFSNDAPQDFVGSTLFNVTLTDIALNPAKLVGNDLDPGRADFEGGIMFVNFETNKGTLQFVAYNDHNGWYGHKATIQSQQLNHTEKL